MKDRYRDAVIGIAAIAGVMACIAMLLAFGSLRELARDSYDVTIRLNRAGGLRYGSQITLDGVPIGVVESVALELEETDPVRLTCRLDEWVRIPVDCRFSRSIPKADARYSCPLMSRYSQASS